MSKKIPSTPTHLSVAVEAARRKVEAIHKGAPPSSQEALDVAELAGEIKRSKHQEYMHQLTISGKSLPEIQSAWHEYYASLSDNEKYEVWNDYYNNHAKAENIIAGTKKSAKETPQDTHPENIQPTAVARTLADTRDEILGNVTTKKKLKPMQHVQSIFFGLATSAVVLIVLLFGFFNERFIAPFIQPSRNVTNTPLIIDGGQVGQNPEVVIPKINVEIPVIYGSSTDELSIQKALEDGVVHYTNTALPGNNGNVAIVGHSSNNIFNKGKYKFAFVLLSKLDIGDTFYLQKDGVRYTYEIYDKKIVKPTEVSVLGPQSKPATATLITCDPPGTSTNRLVVVGQQVSPDPIANQSNQPTNTPSPAIIPSNSPSLWSRFVNIF